MSRKILLLTTVKWPSAARLAGAFSALGCTVEAAFPPGHVLGVSRYLSRAHGYSALRGRASFSAAICDSEPDLIVPCDDRAVTHLLALAATMPEIAPLLERSMGDMASYPVMMTRSQAIAAARDEGITAPLSLAVADEAELERALDVTGLPAVLKTDGSWGGDNVAVVPTVEEARLALRRLRRASSPLRKLTRAVLRKDAHFLRAVATPAAVRVHVQGFVRGEPATSAFACRDGEVLAALHMDVVAWQGATGPASLIRRTDCAAMDGAARKIARRFRLSGLHGLDFMRDEEGVSHLIEINPRATQICHLALSGCDLAAALVGEAARPAITDKPLIALFPQAWVGNAAGPNAPEAFLDVPWDDPATLEAWKDGPSGQATRPMAVLRAG